MKLMEKENIIAKIIIKLLYMTEISKMAILMVMEKDTII